MPLPVKMNCFRNASSFPFTSCCTVPHNKQAGDLQGSTRISINIQIGFRLTIRTMSNILIESTPLTISHWPGPVMEKIASLKRLRLPCVSMVFMGQEEEVHSSSLRKKVLDSFHVTHAPISHNGLSGLILLLPNSGFPPLNSRI